MNVSIVVAVSDGGVIGCNNSIPWDIPEDLRNFRSITMGSSIVMGRKTFESIGRKLPGRTNIVLSRQTKIKVPEGVILTSDFNTSIKEGLKYSKEVFVIGGEEVYKLALKVANKMYLTKVNEYFSGDSYFNYNPKHWVVVSKKLSFKFNFYVMQNKHLKVFSYRHY